MWDSGLMAESMLLIPCSSMLRRADNRLVKMTYRRHLNFDQVSSLSYTFTSYINKEKLENCSLTNMTLLFEFRVSTLYHVAYVNWNQLETRRWAVMLEVIVSFHFCYHFLWTIRHYVSLTLSNSDSIHVLLLVSFRFRTSVVVPNTEVCKTLDCTPTYSYASLHSVLPTGITIP